MPQLMSFFRSLTGPSKLCGLVAAIGFLLILCSWVVPQSSYKLSVFACLSAMIAAGTAFASVTGYNMLAFRERRAAAINVRLPRPFWIGLALSLAYFFSVFIGTAVYYPHGVDLGPSVFFRVAAAAMALFGMSSLGFTQISGLRYRALRSAP